MTLDDSCFYRFHAFALLALCTVLYALLFDPYLDVGPELLVNGDFRAQGIDHWHLGPGAEVLPGDLVGDGSGMVRLHSEDNRKWVVVKQQITLSGKLEKVRLQANIKTREIKKGRRDWHRARLILGSYDKTGQWLPGPHHAALLTGSQSWRGYSQVFSVPQNAMTLQVQGQLPRATGTMWLEKISLREVKLKPLAGILDTLFICLWSVYLFWLIVSFVRQKRPVIMGILLTGAILAVLIGALSPGIKQVQWQQGAMVAIQQALEPHEPSEQGPTETNRPAAPAAKSASLKKKMVELSLAGHFIFFVLVAVFAFAFSGMRVDMLLVDLALFAAVTEFLQIFIRGRTPQLTDWMVDFGGAALGVICVLLYRVLKRRAPDDSGKTVEISG